MHAIKILSCAVLLLVFAGHSSRAIAAPAKFTTVVLAPAASMSEAKQTLRKLEVLLESGIASLPTTKVITAQSAAKATRKAKRPQLRTCEGNIACLKELGTLMKASHVVYAEVSDLGDAQVVFLKAVAVSGGQEPRSTTLKLSKGSNRKRESKAAAAQLLAPNLYVGSLKVQSRIANATVFLDGHKIGETTGAAVSVYVGSHALRVTHPEHSDYVRFVDVRFEEETLVDAELAGLPGLDQRMQAKGILGEGSASGNQIVKYRKGPWYLRWYTITGGVAAIAITSAVLSSGGSSFTPDLIRSL